MSFSFQPEVFKPCRNPQFPHKTALRDPDVFNTPRKFSWSVISKRILHFIVILSKRSAPTSPPSHSSTSLSSSPRGQQQNPSQLTRPLGHAKKFLSSDGKESRTSPKKSLCSQVLAESLRIAQWRCESSHLPRLQLNQLLRPPPHPRRCLPGSLQTSFAPQTRRPKLFEGAQHFWAVSAFQRMARNRKENQRRFQTIQLGFHRSLHQRDSE